MQESKFLATLVAPLLLVACQSSLQVSDDDPRKKALIERECAIYFAIENQLQTTRSNISEGCPDSARALQVDISPIEPPKVIESRFGELIYRRMIARGVSQAQATEVSKSEAFYQLVQESDALYSN